MELEFQDLEYDFCRKLVLPIGHKYQALCRFNHRNNSLTELRTLCESPLLKLDTQMRTPLREEGEKSVKRLKKKNHRPESDEISNKT